MKDPVHFGRTSSWKSWDPVPENESALKLPRSLCTLFLSPSLSLSFLSNFWAGNFSHLLIVFYLRVLSLWSGCVSFLFLVQWVLPSRYLTQMTGYCQMSLICQNHWAKGKSGGRTPMGQIRMMTRFQSLVLITAQLFLSAQACVKQKWLSQFAMIKMFIFNSNVFHYRIKSF